jgi:hypothetical protein
MDPERQTLEKEAIEDWLMDPEIVRTLLMDDLNKAVKRKREQKNRTKRKQSVVKPEPPALMKPSQPAPDTSPPPSRLDEMSFNLPPPQLQRRTAPQQQQTQPIANAPPRNNNMYGYSGFGEQQQQQPQQQQQQQSSQQVPETHVYSQPRQSYYVQANRSIQQYQQNEMDYTAAPLEPTRPAVPKQIIAMINPFQTFDSYRANHAETDLIQELIGGKFLITTLFENIAQFQPLAIQYYTSKQCSALINSQLFTKREKFMYEEKVHKQQEGRRNVDNLIACQTKLVTELGNLYREREDAITQLMDCGVLDSEMQDVLGTQQQCLYSFMLNEIKKREHMIHLFSSTTTEPVNEYLH